MSRHGGRINVTDLPPDFNEFFGSMSDIHSARCSG
jgi:hypothetical protein